MRTALCMLLVAFILQAKCMDMDLDDNAEESSLMTTIYAGNCVMTPTQQHSSTTTTPPTLSSTISAGNSIIPLSQQHCDNPSVIPETLSSSISAENPTIRPSQQYSDIQNIRNLKHLKYIDNDEYYVIGYIENCAQLEELLQEYQMSLSVKFVKRFRRPKNFGERSKYIYLEVKMQYYHSKINL